MPARLPVVIGDYEPPSNSTKAAAIGRTIVRRRRAASVTYVTLPYFSNRHGGFDTRTGRAQPRDQ